MLLSVAIITLNESSNIARAIKSASFADEILVVDTDSSDGTQKIATELGARVIQNPFLGYGQQKNFAASKCNGEWVFSLDADEEISEELQASILKTIKMGTNTGPGLYKVNRRTGFCGKWIYNGGWYPDKLARLYKKEEAKWSEPKVHEELSSLKPDKVGILDGHLNHHSFPSIRSQILTNLKYAGLGAKALLEKSPKGPSLIKLLIKPLGKFLECYIVKKGFLDGVRGLVIAVNAAHSVFMKYSFAYFDSKKLGNTND